jgi:hypothetical protein
MIFTAEFLLQIGVALASGIGAYSAIRADLATLHEKATNAIKTADAAHSRIDHLMRHHE